MLQLIHYWSPVCFWSRIFPPCSLSFLLSFSAPRLDYRFLSLFPSLLMFAFSQASLLRNCCLLLLYSLITCI